MEDDQIEYEETAFDSPNDAEIDEDEDIDDDNVDDDDDQGLSVSVKGGKRKEGKEALQTGKKPGIVYLSRIPTMMRPQRIRKIFSQYGDVGRVFLQPEDKFNRKTRKKTGGAKAKRFTEGWIEYLDKKIAKSVALTLNNTPIGGRKRSRCYEELWNVKYLHRFQWAHLAERLEYERQVRQQRIRTEISQAKRETSFYMKSVELGDRLEQMEKKKRERGKEWIAKVRAHKQRVTQDEFNDSKPARSGKVTKGTLGKIFKKSGQS